jgi:hypothetical protein
MSTPEKFDMSKLPKTIEQQQLHLLEEIKGLLEKLVELSTPEVEVPPTVSQARATGNGRQRLPYRPEAD